jgi:tetratricopeptide (TPR) repeat protein
MLCAVLALPLAALAAADTDTTPGGRAPADPVLERVAQAEERGEWALAAAALREALASDPGKAEYHNRYAYALRKGQSPDMGLVFKHYNEALRLDPKHRGAHEYIGEAYLMVGNLAKAKEHLGVLDKLCFLPCSQYTDLKKAISDYEKRRAASR